MNCKKIQNLRDGQVKIKCACTYKLMVKMGDAQKKGEMDELKMGPINDFLQ